MEFVGIWGFPNDDATVKGGAHRGGAGCRGVVKPPTPPQVRVMEVGKGGKEWWCSIEVGEYATLPFEGAMLPPVSKLWAALLGLLVLLLVVLNMLSASLPDKTKDYFSDNLSLQKNIKGK